MHNRHNSTFRVKPPKPVDYKTALRKAIAKRSQSAAKGLQQPSMRRKPRSRLRAKPDPQMAAWSRKVKERDGGQCQWPGIAEYLPIAPADFKIAIKLAMGPCATGDKRIDSHHIAERSLRPDLKYSVPNGISLCRSHHDWLSLNRAAAIALHLLSDETYEKARKDLAA